jgi:hypothetical protein
VPTIYPNLKDVKEFQPIKPGTYKASITKCETKTSKSDNPMIVPTFGVEVDGEVVSRDAFLLITGKGAFRFDELLRACRFDDIADRMRAGDDVPFDTDQLVGQRLQVTIENEPYENRIVDRVQRFLKA